ncbi:MAG: HPP family protein [Candidatus Magnetoovum sp. WYHC-5]|nr:HPP family protein [Candidatus Magnetoovum sp. WYHC-5]
MEKECYFSKMRGSAKRPPRASWKEVIWSWIGAFLGIVAVAYLDANVLSGTDYIMLIGSFGASAVLIYGAVKSPLAQPRNLIGGHIISAIVGVTCYKFLNTHMCIASAMAVATAIALMHMVNMLHPPGGATSLIAVIGSNNIHALGYEYVLIPVGAGAIIMLIIALIINNIPSSRRYPEFWW